MVDKYNALPRLETKFKDLEARVRTLETAPRLSSASVGEGGLIIQGGNIRIQDPNGNDQVRLGQLMDGTYGIEQVVDNAWVSMLQLAKGTQSASDSSSINVDAGTGTTSAWNISGPSVNFTTFTGKFAILLVAQCNWYGYKSSVSTGYQLLNQANSAEILAPDQKRASEVANGNSVDASQTLVWAETVLTQPGDYQIKQAYRSYAGVSEGVTASYSKRAIMVFPY